MKRVGGWYRRLRLLLLAGMAGSAVPGGGFEGDGGVAQAQTDLVTLAWEEARRANTVEAYEAFLEDYPISPYANDAFRALVEMSLAGPGGGASRGLSADLY